MQGPGELSKASFTGVHMLRSTANDAKKTKNKPHILHRCTYVQSSKLVCTTLCIDPRLTDSHSGRTKAVILTVIPLLCYVDV